MSSARVGVAPDPPRPTADIPDSWWREHAHVAYWLLVAGMAVFFLRYAAEVFIPLTLSAILFYALDPAVDLLQRGRVPRPVGAALMLGMVVVVLGGLGYALRDEAAQVVADVPDGARRLRALLQSGDASALESLRQATEEIDRTAEAAAAASAGRPAEPRVQVERPPFQTSEYLWSGSVGVAGLVAQLVMVGFLSYFLLVANDRFKRMLVKHAAATLAGKRITVNVVEAIGRQIEGFILIQILTSVIVGVATGASLWWLGVENAGVWGLLAGVLNSIPYFGPVIVTGGLAVVAFMQFGTFGMTVVVAGVALLITALEGWLLSPWLFGRAASMNHVAVFVGLVFWTWMWGIWGTLLAMPMMMIVKAVCDHVEDFQPVAEFLGE